jgi:hypothetical protein
MESVLEKFGFSYPNNLMASMVEGYTERYIYIEDLLDFGYFAIPVVNYILMKRYMPIL